MTIGCVEAKDRTVPLGNQHREEKCEVMSTRSWGQAARAAQRTHLCSIIRHSEMIKEFTTVLVEVEDTALVCVSRRPGSCADGTCKLIFC